MSELLANHIGTDPTDTENGDDSGSKSESLVQPRRSGTRTAMALVANSAVGVGFIVMVTVFGIMRPETFLTSSTLQDLLNQAAIPVILACGITFTMSVGEFDLSFTAVLGMAAAVVIVLMANRGYPILVSCLAALALALAVGLVIGLLVTFGKASSFIVTLALGSVLTGLEIMLTDNQSIYRNIPPSFSDFASNSVIGLKAPVWVTIAIVALAFVLLHATKFGRHVYAIGGNSKAAFLAGVRVRRVRVYCFILLAGLAGVAAIIATSKTASYYPNISGGLLLSTYAAVFLGAAMSTSNRFTVVGSALGVVWLLTLQTGLTQLNQPAWVSTLIQGLVLVTAVLIAARNRGRSQ